MINPEKVALPARTRRRGACDFYRVRPQVIKTYLVTDGSSVKIGKTRNIRSRIRSLQTAHPRPLRVLLVLDGDVEYMLHEKFKDSRLKGEWFEYSPALHAFLSEHTGQGKTKPFYDWLIEKQHSQNLGAFAKIVASDRTFPKTTNQLSKMLEYYGESPHREALKFAHKGWRRYRDRFNAKPRPTAPTADAK